MPKTKKDAKDRGRTSKDKHRVSKEKHRVSNEKPRVSKDKRPDTIRDKGATSKDGEKERKKSHMQSEDSHAVPKCWPKDGPMIVSPGPGEPLGPHRRWPKQEKPIKKMSEIPKDWNWYADEPDLPEADIDGNIERCHERIETGIMPQVFESRLEVYQNVKTSQEKMKASQPPGLSMDVVYRLKSLERMKKHFKKIPGKSNRDNYINIKGLIAAYRSKKLDWCNGNYFTIWQAGKLVRGPIAIKTANLRKLYNEFEGQEGLWVEGLGTPEPALMGFVEVLPPILPGKYRFSQHSVNFALRVPGSEDYQVLEFRDDTGATLSMLTKRDIKNIEETSPTKALCLGGGEAREAFGYTDFGERYLLEVAIVDSKGNRAPMTKWVKAIFFAMDYREEKNVYGNAYPQRLSGSWWRHILYTATAPDNERNLYVSDSKAELFDRLPAVDPSIASPPDIPQTFLPLLDQMKLEEQDEAEHEAEGELRRGDLHPPTYMQYMEWVEEHNKSREPDEHIQASKEQFQAHTLNQVYWTRKRDWSAENLRPPTKEQYKGWLERLRATSLEDERRGNLERLRHSSRRPAFIRIEDELYEKFKRDGRNWLPPDVETRLPPKEEAEPEDDDKPCISQ